MYILIRYDSYGDTCIDEFQNLDDIKHHIRKYDIRLEDVEIYETKTSIDVYSLFP